MRRKGLIFGRVQKPQRSAQTAGSKGDIRNKWEEEVKSSKLKVECKERQRKGPEQLGMSSRREHLGERGVEPFDDADGNPAPEGEAR